MPLAQIDSVWGERLYAVPFSFDDLALLMILGRRTDACPRLLLITKRRFSLLRLKAIRLPL